MSRCTRSRLLAIILMIGNLTVHPVHAAPYGCAMSLFAPNAGAMQTGAGACSLWVRGTFNCLHGNSGACDFCITFQVQIRNPDGSYSMWTRPELDSWTQTCTSKQTINWTGGCSGMPVGHYRWIVLFWSGGCGSFLMDRESRDFEITG